MPEEIVVTGYPRSGTTHTARLLGDILNSPVTGIQDAVPLGKEGQDRTGDYLIYQSHVMPSDREEQALLPSPYTFGLNCWTNQKVVHVIRDPRAIALSIKHYWELNSISDALDGMEQASRPPYSDYNAFVQRWAKTRVPTIRYRDLSEHPFETLWNLLCQWELQVEPRHIQEAIERQSFAKRKQQAETDDSLPYGKGIQFKHLHKGIPDDFRMHFTDADYAKARTCLGESMRILGYPLTMNDWESARTILENIFTLHPNAIRACQVLFELARQVREGAIVELGTYQGKSAIALALGARAGHDAKVYAVDDHLNHTDWANNEYNLEDVTALEYNLHRAQVQIEQILLDSQEAARQWNKPVALYFWDISVPGQLFPDWLAWREHIQVGGIGFLRDTFDKRLGSEDVLQYEKNRKEFIVEMEEPGVLLLKRVK